MSGLESAIRNTSFITKFCVELIIAQINNGDVQGTDLCEKLGFA